MWGDRVGCVGGFEREVVFALPGGRVLRFECEAGYRQQSCDQEITEERVKAARHRSILAWWLGDVRQLSDTSEIVWRYVSQRVFSRAARVLRTCSLSLLKREMGHGGL